MLDRPSPAVVIALPAANVRRALASHQARLCLPIALEGQLLHTPSARDSSIKEVALTRSSCTSTLLSTMPHHHDHHGSARAYSDTVHANFHEAVSAWFLGPQGENADLLKGLFGEAVELQTRSRLSYHPEDGVSPSSSLSRARCRR